MKKTNIITLAHQKGGTGKSTLAWNIAIEFFKRYKKYGYKEFMFVDLDNQESISMTNRLRMRHNKEPLPITRFTDMEIKELTEFINNIDSEALIVIDSGGYDADLNRLAIVASDFIITPVSSDYMELFGLQKFKNIINNLSQIQQKQIIVNVLLNKIDPKTKQFEDVEEFISQNDCYNLMSSIIRFRSDFKHAIGYGCSVGELDKNSKAHEEILELIKEIEIKAELNG